MEMQYRCEHCGELFVVKTSMRVCPRCHHSLPSAIVGPESPPPPSGRQKTGHALLPTPGIGPQGGSRSKLLRSGIRSSASRTLRRVPFAQRKEKRGGGRVRFGYLERQGTGWVLHGASEFRVEVEGPYDPSFLEHRTLPFVVKAWRRDVAVVVPKDGKDLQLVLDAHGRARDLTERARTLGRSRLGPKPPGTSRLETMPGDLMATVREIRRLAQKKDDPEAWAALANGYRVPSLRSVLEEAMAQVGWGKIDSLVRDFSGNWPPELGAWLAAQRAKADERLQKFQPVHGGAWAREEYGTVED